MTKIQPKDQKSTSYSPTIATWEQLSRKASNLIEATELIRRLKRYQVANHKCLIVKYANDNRYKSDDIATHDQQTLAAVATTKLLPLNQLALEYSVIGIDEGQFFSDTVEFCENMANSGKIVIVAALDGTFQRQPFGDILQLVPLAEHVIKLTAVCMICYKEASYTKRKGCELELEVIGGADKYMAVCRSCYSEEKNDALESSMGSSKRDMCNDILQSHTHSPDSHCC